MCSRTTCRSCGKPTVSGCGRHVDQALRGVPASERCKGHPAAKTSTTPAAAAPKKSGGLFARLFSGD